MFRRFLGASALLAVFASPAFAITYIVPTDRDLVRRADAIIIGTAIESHAELTAAGGIVTVATLTVDEVVKGGPDGGQPLRLVELGGTVGQASMFIPGSPRYTSGQRYLVFLRHDYAGNWATWGFGLGQFLYEDGLLTRTGRGDTLFGVDEADWSPHVERARDAGAFLSFVRLVAANDLVPASEEYFASPFTGGFHLPSIAKPANFVRVPAVSVGSLDGLAAMSAATGNWTSAGAGVHYSVGSLNNALTSGLTAPDGHNAVLFNGPHVPAGVAAIGGVSNVGSTYVLNSVTYTNITEVDVEVGNNFTTNQATFNGLLTHEFGHTLGFRHSDGTSDPNSPNSVPGCVIGTTSPPCTHSAIMNSSVAFNQSSLLAYDTAAIGTVYGGTAGTRTDYLWNLNYRWQTPPTVAFEYCCCTPAGISSQPQASPSTIASGSSSQLSVTASGTGPFTYQWYIGNPSSTTTPTGTNSPSISVSPASTTTYWVRISNSCGSPTDSNAVTVTVQPCVAPQVTQQPQASPSTISQGNSSQLSVIASGTATLTYQWYVGSFGDTGNPVSGGTQATINVAPAGTTTYWVKITNGCGFASGNSVTVTVTPPQCNPPVITAQPGDQTVTPGTVNLSVGFTGTSPSVIWYQGTAPDTSHFVGSGASIQVPITVTTTFWVQLSNNCGLQNSRTATITVSATCTPPNISSATASPASVAPAGASTLTVVATGSSLAYQWYQGLSGVTTNAISGATTASTIVNPSATTSYWVRVTNACGTTDSITVKVTVTAECTAPAVTTQPLGTTVIAGQKVTLSVIASGSALTYQWYTGSVDDTSTPIGTNDSSVTVQPLVETSYWVKITNSCGTAKSNAATIIANPSKRRATHH